MKSSDALILSLSFIFQEIHRHRILTGDSIDENGKFDCTMLVNKDFFLEKYLFMISISDMNQNLTHT